jgi:hypothetical protein
MCMIGFGLKRNGNLYLESMQLLRGLVSVPVGEQIDPYLSTCDRYSLSTRKEK